MEQDHSKSHDFEATAGLAAVVDAIEALGEELASRNPDDMSFTVEVPEDPPVVRILAELINELGQDVDAYHRALSRDMETRSRDLTQAYNALQAKTDEVQVELEMARKIQHQLIPSGGEFPRRDEVDFGGYYESMDNIGGDIYDVIRFGRNSYGLLIADVSGHGIPAALITALVKIAFRSKARFGVSPVDVAEEVNSELNPIMSELDFFVTAFFAIVDLETGRMTYTNCGHHPTVIARQGEEELIFLDTRGRFLGFFDEVGAEEGAVELRPGDLVYFYTDGIIEARNFFDEEYQSERLNTALLRSAEVGRNASETVGAVRRDMENFSMGAEQRDDQSMFAMKFNAYASVENDSAESGEQFSRSADTVSLEAIRDRSRKIYARAKEAVDQGDYAGAAGLFEALYLIAPQYAQLPAMIERLRSRF